MNGMFWLPASSYHTDLLYLHGPFTVQRLFSHAWHLRSQDGWILTVSTAPYNGPLAIRLNRTSLERLPIVPGMTAHLRDDTLVLGAVAVPLERARPWNPPSPSAPLHRLCASPLLIPPPEPRSDRGLLAAVLRSIPPHANPTPPRPARGEEGLERAVRGLLIALLEGNEPALRTHALALLGRGPGLTPAGDDLLCGLLAGLHVLGARAPSAASQVARLAALRGQLHAFLQEVAGSRTTALSRTLLHYAGQGVAVEPLLDVLCTLGTEGEVNGLDTLLAIGHTSGADMLAGAILAAAALAHGEGSVGCPGTGPT